MPSSVYKKAKFHLQLWDGIWTIPVAIFLFLAIGLLLQSAFYNSDDPAGSPGFYDPSFLQAMFYASCVQVFINSVVWLGIYFNFRAVKRYHSGQKKLVKDPYVFDAEASVSERVINKSKEDFNLLRPWQRVCVLLGLYCFLSGEWLLIWLHLK